VVNVGIIPIGLKMITTVGVFKDKVIRAMYAELTKKLGSVAFKTSLRRGAKQILEKALRAHPTYHAMVAQDGILRAELGVVDSASAMDSLVRAWVQSTHITVSRPRIMGHRIVGTIVSIRAIQADYSDVLDKVYASYTTEKGDVIPWLDWLLTKGVDTLVASHVAVTLPTAMSRTGTNTVMIKTRGAGWGVPTDYAGMPENNYATQSVLAAVPEIEHMFMAEVKRRL